MNLLWCVPGLFWLVTALVFRRRAGSFSVLQPSEKVPRLQDRFFTAPGVELSESTRRAASAHAEKNDLEYLDLIPSGAPAMEMLGLAYLIDPRSYRTNRFAVSFPAGYAILAVETSLRPCSDQPHPENLAALIRFGKCMKRFASASSDVAVAPGLAAARSEGLGWYELAALLGHGLPWAIGIQVTQLLLILAGLILSPLAGLFSLIAYQLQVAIVLARSPLRPSGLFQATLFRVILDLLSLAKAIRSRTPAGADTARVEFRDQYYREALAEGTVRFFEERRTDCPLCGSENLGPLLVTSDLLQGKPGHFTLEECLDCSLVFQNPRLSGQGLEFYYADFYEGLGHRDLQRVFSMGSGSYVARARSVAEHHEPERWLDVGTGHGHFCAVARDIWPQAHFDGLDMGESVEEAEQRGWLDGHIVGMFPEEAASLRGRYDVISMFHYLEHTVDPRAEIEASHEALSPGGVIVIEVPNPECPLGRWLGKFWVCWLQPQHLHLLPPQAMKELLSETGFDTLELELEEAHIPVDFLFAARLFRNWAGGFPNHPWRHRRTLMGTLRYYLASGVVMFLSIGALIIDRVAAAVFRRMGISNAYRLVARKAVESE